MTTKRSPIHRRELSDVVLERTVRIAVLDGGLHVAGNIVPNIIDTSYASTLGYSHAWNVSLQANAEMGNPSWNTIHPDSEQVTVTISDSTGDRTATVSFRLGAYGPQISGGDSLPTKRIVGVVKAFPQQGDSALIAVSRMRATATDLSYSCTDDRGLPSICINGRYVWTADTAYLYSVSTTAGSPSLHLLRVLPGTIVYAIALSETNLATVATFGAEVDTMTNNGGSRTVQWCTIRYLNNRVDGSPAKSISSLDGCHDLSYNLGGAGTLSSRRVSGRMQLEARPIRRARPSLSPVRGKQPPVQSKKGGRRPK